MNNMRNKILMTLALLLTAVGGAWAQEETLLTTITATSTDSYSETTAGVVTVTHDNSGIYGEYGWVWWDNPGSITVEAKEGYTITRCVFKQNSKTPVTVSSAPFKVSFIETANPSHPNQKKFLCQGDWNLNMNGVSSIEVYGYAPAPAAEPAEPAIDVKWDPATKTGNFTMPAYDVEIAPIYAPVAQWAKVENVDQLPTAIEGIFAESTDAIVKAGTVAKIGETENVQGTVMYAVGTSATEQPALTAFSADVPTAKLVADAGDVYVWYYIKGADAPEGEEATAENTFNDSEICAEPIKVTVLSNKFDIQFNAANDNTIEAGKATVTVGGSAATVTDGKLEDVKMGSEVKVTAKEGYKFRKVEVKKGAKADPSETITFSGGKNANYTYTGTHFSATGEADPTDGTFELNKWSSVTINATDGKTITKVVFSYRENGNNDLDQLSFSSGTFDGIDTVNDVNATTLSVTSTTVGATRLNGVTIYYK